MIVIAKIENRTTIIVITLLFIILIGYLDFITGPDFSFSLFYLIPISLLALYKGTKVSAVLVCTFFSSLLCLLAEYYSSEYPSSFIPLWNGFVRFVMFTAIGLLLIYLKQNDKRLKSANRDLKVLNEEKNKFIGIAAHDLRSPISGINSLSNLIMDEYKDSINPKMIEALQSIGSMSDNILVLLKDLLDVAKIESGNVELKLKIQDYISFIKHQISLSQMIADRKNISIVFQCQLDSIMLDFDEHYLFEVIDNLLSNAIKYSYNNGEIVIKISLQDAKQILTEIIDNGKGIPEEEQQKLFNYFQITSTMPTAGEQSTGLGLAIAKRIVTLHKGEIGLKSELNKGSNFYFTLPINNGL